MNYRHIYHAGNFSEMVKHGALTIVLDYLRRKDSGFCFIDTHAGEGIYDLKSAEAEKTNESSAGIQRLIQSGADHPQCLENYLQILKIYQSGNQLQHYPGSPEWARQMLRSQDCMILNEFHPEANRRLRLNLPGNAHITIHQRDAYEFLPAVLPPPMGRGVVLIDPPFEQKDENDKIEKLMEKCLKRWAHGIYLIWYPITVQRSWNLQAVALQPGIDRYLIAGLTIAAETPNAKGLLGCQLLIVNPPWKLDETLRELLQYLWEIFSVNQQGGWFVECPNSR
jgi:23S rRNA (adenine2030-N6)-methyltransferase